MKVRSLSVVLGVALAVAGAPTALADGTETLGPPSLSLASGTGVVAAGIGMHGFANSARSFEVSIPSGATVKQVLLYWQGHGTGFADQHCYGGPPGVDDSISVNGNAVTGTLIGGPTNFFLAEHFATYRGDITSLNLVSAGANTLTISDMHFLSCFPYATGTDGNDGAGVLVIYDDGSDSTVVGVRDGQDLAYAFFAAPLDTTVAQTFSFAPAPSNRPGTLATLAGSVSGPDLSGLRGNRIQITFNAGGTGDTVLVDPWQSNQGDEFDALNSAIDIPAGASSMTVQALSVGGDRAASLGWIAASLHVVTPPQEGGQGCTPGYWKNHLSSWGPTGYSPSQALSSVFSATGLGTLGSSTLLDALTFDGGPKVTDKKKNLLRIAVASLLSSAHPGVSFAPSTAEVISRVNAALVSNDPATIETLKNELDALNNAGCPLGN